MNKKISLQNVGTGIIMYSKSNAAHIKEEEDYLTSNYLEISDVLNHIYKGTIVGFSTGSPGDYKLNIFKGYPGDVKINRYSSMLRLFIEVKDNEITFRDLYDLMEWDNEVNDENKLKIDNGYYHVTIGTIIPLTGIIGDNQDIDIYLKKLNEIPKLKYIGVPSL